MTAHKHAAMIKAKADNMELVVLRKHHEGDWIEVADQSEIRIKQSGEYFLCLPQHKEACLHWLNGGDVELNSEFMGEWTEYKPFKIWRAGSVFMQEDYKIRIKPRKEKRWIAVDSDGNVAPKSFHCELDAKFWVNYNTEKCQDYWQFIQIEVEI